LKASADKIKIKTTLRYQFIGYFTGVDHTNSYHQQPITYSGLNSLRKWHLNARASVDMLRGVILTRANACSTNDLAIRKVSSSFQLSVSSRNCSMFQPVSSADPQHKWHGVRNGLVGQLRNLKE
jgi:hypothetical protein